MPNYSLEHRHVKQFLDLFFKKEVRFEFQKIPEPDFCVILDDGIIGLEHTTLVRYRDSQKICYNSHCINADRIMHEAQILFHTKDSTCLTVFASFRCDYRLNVENPVFLKSSNVKRLSKFLAGFLLEHTSEITNLDHGKHIRFDSYNQTSFEQILPEEFEYISIYNTTKAKQPCWSAIQSMVIPKAFDSLEFDRILTKKNTKAKGYRIKYAEKWLLIVEDHFNLTSSFDFEGQIQRTFTCSFDRLFVLRRGMNLYYELDTVKNLNNSSL